MNIVNRLLLGFGCLLILSTPVVFALEQGFIRYDKEVLIDYSQVDLSTTEHLANSYFDKAIKSEDIKEQQVLLEQAAGQFFILTKIKPDNTYYITQLARVYDYLDKSSYAKGYFSSVLKINKNDPMANFYLGEYYFKRNDYKKALYFYNVSFNNGYYETYDVTLKMAMMYEKLGDLLRANQYYKKAYLANYNDASLPNKIRELESVKYKGSGYYSRRRQNK